jgi:hypothetical protein
MADLQQKLNGKSSTTLYELGGVNLFNQIRTVILIRTESNRSYFLGYSLGFFNLAQLNPIISMIIV